MTKTLLKKERQIEREEEVKDMKRTTSWTTTGCQGNPRQVKRNKKKEKQEV